MAPVNVWKYPRGTDIIVFAFYRKSFKYFIAAELLIENGNGSRPNRRREAELYN